MTDASLLSSRHVVWATDVEFSFFPRRMPRQMEFSSVFETTILHYITLYDRMTQQPPQYLSVFPLNLRPLCSFLSLTFGLVKKKKKKRRGKVPWNCYLRFYWWKTVHPLFP